MNQLATADEEPEPYNETARGGSFSVSGRRAAVSGSIALLGAYFSGGTQPLVADHVVGPDEGEQDANRAPVVLAGLRLRVAIAASSRLLSLVRSIERRPNFHYHLRRVDQVGSLSGQLDINTWIARLGTSPEQLVFPSLEASRSGVTPENIMVAYALLWMRGELSAALRASGAGINAVEARTARLQTRELTRLAQLPAYADCRSTAAGIRAKRSVKELTAQVRRRLKRRVVRNATPYETLAQWITETVDGAPPVDAGDVEWEFYGEQFDRTLFELWCLYHLMKLLSQRLDQPELQVDAKWSGNGSTYRFKHFAGEIDIIYQNEMSTSAGKSGRWHRESGVPLGGRPDIVVRVSPRDAEPTYVIIDPKLRQRPAMPTEEIYKLLGYFENFDMRPRRGAILFYSSEQGPLTQYQLKAGLDEEIAAVRLNPSSGADGVAGLQIVVDLVLAALSMKVAAPSVTSVFGDMADPEVVAEQHVVNTRQQLMAWAATHETDLQPTRNMLEGLLTSERWGSLLPDVQTMLATAVCTGNQLEQGADYSGPVIGMCAALERIIFDAVVEHVIHAHPEYRRDLLMLGPVLTAIQAAAAEELPTGKFAGLHLKIRAYLDSQGIDQEEIRRLVPRWMDMNRRFRRPAAHHQSVSRTEWQNALSLFLAEGLLSATWSGLRAH